MRSALRRTTRAIPFVFMVSLLVFALEKGEWLFSFEAASLDTWIHLAAPEKSKNIMMIVIGDHDYEELFGGVSPLDPEIIKNLIISIIAGGAEVVGVDVNTEAHSFRKMDLSSEAVPIVWARDALYRGDQLIPLQFLGNSLKRARSGLSVFRVDADGVIRRYQRCFKTPSGMEPSLAWHIARVFRRHPVKCQEEDEELVLNFSGDRFRFDRLGAEDIVRISRNPEWATQKPLKGRIVLLGGGYRAGRDEYVTPVGSKSGLELTAFAIESELREGGIRITDHLVITAIEFVVGLIIVLFHGLLPARRALLVSLGLIPLGALAASLVAFYTFAYWANAVPVLAAILIHQIYDSIREPGSSEGAQSLDRREAIKSSAVGNSAHLGGIRIRKSLAGKRRKAWLFMPLVAALLLMAILSAKRQR